MVVGQLSTSSPDVARDAWRRFAAGGAGARTMPVLVRRKDGRLVEAILLGVEPVPGERRWQATLELVRMPNDRSQATALASVLAEWRAAERQLATLPDGDSMRPVVEAQVSELRERYRQLQPQPRTAPAW